MLTEMSKQVPTDKFSKNTLIYGKYYASVLVDNAAVNIRNVRLG
jgi:hypothetical protein